jgi:hypothetical protein
LVIIERLIFYSVIGCHSVSLCLLDKATFTTGASASIISQPCQSGILVNLLRFEEFYANKELALFSGQGENVISFSNLRPGSI